MRLSQLVAGLSITAPGADPEITGISEDSRRIAPGMLFVAVPGTSLDGHAYIGDAVVRGAAAIVAESTGAIPAGMPVVGVLSSRDALALLAARFFETTSSSLSLIGFTGIRLHSPLLGRGHLRNVALALTYVIGTGLPATTAREVVASLAPLRRRMERCDAGGRTVLDDTAAHPDSLKATFEVAAMLPHRAMAVVYAIRGRRGPDINRLNAVSLADLCLLHGVEPLIVTQASDRVGPLDMATTGEVDATRQALVARDRRFVWHDALGDALREAYARTIAGDLILLAGAQGMNEAKAIIGMLNAEC